MMVWWTNSPLTGDLQQHLGVDKPSLAIHHAGLAHRGLREQHDQDVHDGARLRRPQPGDGHGEVHLAPRLLPGVLHLLSCIHSARYYVQAGFLITTLDSDIPASYVQHAVIRGGNFWSMGLRALYFMTTLLMWIFGLIHMFVCSVSMVGVHPAPAGQQLPATAPTPVYS